MREYSREISSVIREFLTEDDWAFDFDEDNGMFHTDVALKSRLGFTDVLIDVHQDYYQIFARVFLNQAEQDCARMTAMLNRINCEITFGHFELGENGSLRYRYVLPVSGIPCRKAVHDSLYIPSYLIDHYAEEILSVSCQDHAGSCCMKCMHRKAPAQEKLS